MRGYLLICLVIMMITIGAGPKFGFWCFARLEKRLPQSLGKRQIALWFTVPPLVMATLLLTLGLLVTLPFILLTVTICYAALMMALDLRAGQP